MTQPAIILPEGAHMPAPGTGPDQNFFADLSSTG